ncbi:hypothetical protein [Sphingomonas oligophenolica]|uniref:hypothetical protein n=1 Tax=Sphingomonas oligophenolica TaxID=301154 RepID=UPI00112B21B6|nr:hypothetical protein [Sphingomonas oligophenolica]
MSVTTPHRVRRLASGALEHYFPDPDDQGMYELGDPKKGAVKHHKVNSIFVGSIEMALYLVREYGFSIRMRGNISGQRNLISADKIEFLR